MERMLGGGKEASLPSPPQGRAWSPQRGLCTFRPSSDSGTRHCETSCRYHGLSGLLCLQLQNAGGAPTSWSQRVLVARHYGSGSVMTFLAASDRKPHSYWSGKEKGGFSRLIEESGRILIQAWLHPRALTMSFPLFLSIQCVPLHLSAQLSCVRAPSSCRLSPWDGKMAATAPDFHLALPEPPTGKAVAFTPELRHRGPCFTLIGHSWVKCPPPNQSLWLTGGIR